MSYTGTVFKRKQPIAIYATPKNVGFVENAEDVFQNSGWKLHTTLIDHDFQLPVKGVFGEAKKPWSAVGKNVNNLQRTYA